jgi:hypothetical protein
MSISKPLRVCATAALVAFAHAASAQNPNEDNIRNQCLAEAGRAYPSQINSEYQNARKQVYENCMRRHGLRF